MSNANKKVLVTGGAGYIGSHTVVEMIKEGYDIIVVDNFINAIQNKVTKKAISLERVEKITGVSIKQYEVDICNRQQLEQVFEQNQIDCVIHFAALKAVGESCQIPLDYYQNNIGGSAILLEVMKKFGVRKLIFSSSATVYGTPNYLPIDENHPVGTSCTNPYGRTKFFMEEIMKDVCNSEKGWSIFLLRYFNPVGAHSSGLIGEDPRGIPNNLMPYISQVAVGRLPQLQVFGGDYDTIDGTGVRDYIHVVDLAQGHVAALNVIFSPSSQNVDLQNVGWRAFNLGTGSGYSVLETIKTFEKVTERNIPYKIVGRREGDVAAAYADPTRAEKELGWRAKKNLSDMCEDSWRWQSQNPKGFLSD